MNSEKFVRLRTDNTFDTVELDSHDLLHGFYAAINCDCIETVAAGRIGQTPILMIVDESGFLNGKPFNPLATPFYNGSPIVGDVLFATTGYRDGEPDMIGFTVDQLEDVTTFVEAVQYSNNLSMKNRMAEAKAEAERRNGAAEPHAQQHDHNEQVK